MKKMMVKPVKELRDGQYLCSMQKFARKERAIFMRVLRGIDQCMKRGQCRCWIVPSYPRVLPKDWFCFDHIAVNGSLICIFADHYQRDFKEAGYYFHYHQDTNVIYISWEQSS